MMTPSEKRRVWKHGLVVCGMFAFAFALAPLYDAFCEVTGWNGRIEGESSIESAEQIVEEGSTAEARNLQFMLTADKERNTPAEFESPGGVHEITTGKMFHATYRVKNTSDTRKTYQATFRLSPGDAGSYLKKMHCFCWDEIVLEPGEEKQLPLRMVVSPELSPRVGYLALHYTLFEKEEKDIAQLAQ